MKHPHKPVEDPTTPGARVCSKCGGDGVAINSTSCPISDNAHRLRGIVAMQANWFQGYFQRQFDRVK